MSAGAVDIDLEPLRVDGDVDLFGLRQDHDGGGRGVDATLRLGLGDALDTVHAILELQPRVGAPSTNLEDHFFEAAPLRRTLREQVDLPAPRLGVAAVHSKQVRGKQSRLIPTGALANLHDDVLVIGGILWHQGELELSR